MDTPIEIFGTIAATQHGLVTWDQLIDAGFTARQIATLVERRRVRRVRPRVYCIAGTPSTWEQVLRGALLTVGAEAIASHSSAARLWTFAYSPETMIEVTVGRARRTTSHGIRLHRSRCLEDSDVALRGGMRCTTFERTLCDCSAALTEFQLGRTLDDGLRRGLASLVRLRACAERIESGPGRHMSSIRRLLLQRGPEFNAGGSASELRVLEVLKDSVVPPPVQQHVVRVHGRRFELDYAWPEYQVFVEYYGLSIHSGPSAVAYDSERLNLLTSTGWTPLVFTDASSDREILPDRRSPRWARRGHAHVP